MYVQVTQNVTAEVRVYRKYYRDVIAIVRKVGRRYL